MEQIFGENILFTDGGYRLYSAKNGSFGVNISSSSFLFQVFSHK